MTHETTTALDEGRLAHALDHAEMAFWNQFAACYPEITTGDLDPGAVHALTAAMEDAARAWLTWNGRFVCPACGSSERGCDTAECRSM
jgi:hypothetical protein